jgi:hypothetical protein
MSHLDRNVHLTLSYRKACAGATATIGMVDQEDRFEDPQVFTSGARAWR